MVAARSLAKQRSKEWSLKRSKLRAKIKMVSLEIAELKESIRTSPLGVPPDDARELSEAKAELVHLNQMLYDIKYM